MLFEQAGDFIINKLRTELPAHLTYHQVDHTLDVFNAAERIGKAEGISAVDIQLVLTAAWYHDTGFLVKAVGHEEESCRIAKEVLPRFDYTNSEIEIVCGLIWATRIPQSPRNHLEQIMADADLDYLGRNDFKTISNKLYNELAFAGKINNRHEWDFAQVKFMENHHYFTQTAIKSRQAQKDLNFAQIKAQIHQHTSNVKRLHLPHWLIDTIYIVAGILFCGFALQSFLIPNEFFDGGVTGISLLVHELYHKNIAYVIVLANIPFIIMGAFQVNKSFAIKTFAAVIGLGLCLSFVHYPQITSDKLLVSIFGGAFMGIGVGLAIRGGCALDGIEVLALYTGRRISFTISEIILGINIVIFLIAAIKLGLPTALYSIMTYYTASRTISFVIEGLEEYTGVTIISGQSEQVKEQLVMSLGRGITVYKGERGFLKDSFDISQPVDIIFTIVTRLEVRRLRNLVHDIDPKAFIFTSTIKEAAGGVLKRKPRH
jgi:uncharacterized membrane-anchored protein YitT (DUF2179 family)/predicted metal-dependent HD superfamily phosphohydrolase